MIDHIVFGLFVVLRQLDRFGFTFDRSKMVVICLGRHSERERTNHSHIICKPLAHLLTIVSVQLMLVLIVVVFV